MIFSKPSQNLPRCQRGGSMGGAAAQNPDTLDLQTRAVFEAIGTSPVDPDTVADHAGLPAAAVQRSLLDLELKGFVARDPSGLYYRI